jgi:hypothetical protein
MYGNEQIAEHLWKLCAKSELKHLRNTEPDLKRILLDKNKRIELQLLLKEMENLLKKISPKTVRGQKSTR